MLVNEVKRSSAKRSGLADWKHERDTSVVTISGQVVDVIEHSGVGGVEVVFQTEAGESSTTTNADGSYSIEVATGTYHAFVRDDHVLSVGQQDLVRLPGMPVAETAGIPDDNLLPTVIAATDVRHLDINVLHGGVVSGRVVDKSGHGVPNAVLRARGSDLRPVLGTDIAESDASGNFELHVPPGHFLLEATHKELAGVVGNVELEIEPGATVPASITLTAGCVITGRVVTSDGKPSRDGAIERQFGTGDTSFGPAGRIGTDGTFRWVTGEQEPITLRAWPWKSPPSPAQTFSCSDGARFQEVVFQIPPQAPDIEGTLVDADGQPVALAFVDLQPLDTDYAQQERADDKGKWAVYKMPPGRYRVTASSPGKGVVQTDITAPVANVQLKLSGVGRIEGTAPEVTDGSLEIVFESCNGSVNLPHSPRLIPVVDHKFVVDEVPACELSFTASWHGETVPMMESVPAHGVVKVEVTQHPRISQHDNDPDLDNDVENAPIIIE